MNNMVYVGYITGTHGIKGELKVKSDFEYKDRVFKKDFKIYINNEALIISSYRVHQQFDLITVNDVYDINEIYKYVNQEIYVNKEDLELASNEFLYSDLIGCEIVDDNESLGIVCDLRKSNILLLEIDYSKKYFIPLVDEYVEKVDILAKKIYTKGAKELII